MATNSSLRNQPQGALRHDRRVEACALVPALSTRISRLNYLLYILRHRGRLAPSPLSRAMLSYARAVDCRGARRLCGRRAHVFLADTLAWLLPPAPVGLTWVGFARRRARYMLRVLSQRGRARPQPLWNHSAASWRPWPYHSGPTRAKEHSLRTSARARIRCLTGDAPRGPSRPLCSGSLLPRSPRSPCAPQPSER